jgi:hypothetical protein
MLLVSVQLGSTSPVYIDHAGYKLLCTLSIEENVHFVWIKYLKELSDETGYSSIWINQDIPNYNWLISSIKLLSVLLVEKPPTCRKSQTNFIT